ncbi:Hypothetical predicted protein [Cloeon dipterum]|uniref:non-specific serine/threonine protein kinase n=1 Tax=Cloeon dipterum TaxID=197152 RepID=A0A8S1C054_9INSE|nr:Hypothetical predicted protein [Cloeon dipterum]
MLRAIKEKMCDYIFLEFAPGGELFDRIDPDRGMPARIAQKFFTELISGVEYLHSVGVAHRDLKPENLLLDGNDRLKICDFGLATIYRLNEVLLKPYNAQPADVWSCGIVLVAMLTGELPWDMPNIECPEYVAWKNGNNSLSPWTKIDNMALSLLRKILAPLPSNRITIEKIKEHRWMQKTLPEVDPSAQSRLPKRLCLDSDDDLRLCLSQPAPVGTSATQTGNLPPETGGCCFSQPPVLDDLLLSTQLHSTQSTCSQTSYQKLVKRMTRFFVKTSFDETLTALKELLENKGYSFKVNPMSEVTVTTVDKRKMHLVFKACPFEMDGKILLDFRLSRGCGLEFKRIFVQIKNSLSSIIMKGPVTWPIAIATNSVP